MYMFMHCINHSLSKSCFFILHIFLCTSNSSIEIYCLNFWVMTANLPKMIQCFSIGEADFYAKEGSAKLANYRP